MTRLRIPCPAGCEDGIRWTSRYGGNDPDVWPDGPCETCNGTGDALCDEPRCTATATELFTERGHSYPLCAAHYRTWLEDADAAA